MGEKKTSACSRCGADARDGADFRCVDSGPTKTTEPVTFGVVQLRRRGAMATISIAEGVIAELGQGRRYAVTWSRDRKQFLIRASDEGPFRAFSPAPGRALTVEARGGARAARRFILRFPLPEGLVAAEGKDGVAHMLNRTARTLTVTVPPRFFENNPRGGGLMLTRSHPHARDLLRLHRKGGGYRPTTPRSILAEMIENRCRNRDWRRSRVAIPPDYVTRSWRDMIGWAREIRASGLCRCPLP